MSDDRLLTADEVGEVLSVPVSWVREHLRNREVYRLLDSHRPELVGRDDITTQDERRSIAALHLAYERALV